MPKVEDDKLARQYLLGELSEHDLAKVEERYFEDDEVFGRLSAVEDDLIDAYALDQLSAAERGRFEQRLLLSPTQRERLKFARTLLRTASDPQQIQSNIALLTPTASWWMSPFTFLRTLNPVLSLSAAAVLMLAIIAGWWLIHRSNVSRTQEQQARQTATPRPEQVNQALNENSRQAVQLPSATIQPKQQDPKPEPVVPPQSSRVVTFALLEGVVRDLSSSNRLTIPSDAALVRLELLIERSDFKTYHAELRRTEGNLIWRRERINAKASSAKNAHVVLQLPGSVLTDGDYILTLSGVPVGRTPEAAAEYSFRVVRR